MPRPPLSSADIRALEERAFNAWPALETLVMDGWLLRFADGYTKRANSLNAWRPASGVMPIVEAAAPLYRARGLSLVVRLSPLAGPSADAELAAHRWRSIDETIVMTAPIGPVTPDPAVRILAEPGTEWCDGFASANSVPAAARATHDRMLRAIRLPAAFASLDGPAGTLGWGLAVAERGMVGLFDIVTRPEARRQGVARRLVAALLAWGHDQRATSAYLQVVATNTPAIALYRGLGFREAYRYHYRIAPA